MKIKPTNKEQTFDANYLLVTKTDLKGILTYANQHFIDIVQLPEEELIGKPHKIIRHPDMPKIIFKYLWQYLQKQKEIHAYVKNLCADGSYYWVMANVTPSMYKGKTVGYHSSRRKPTKEALSVIIPLYEKLLQAEKRGGMSASEAVMNELLQSKGMYYDEFILSF
ncbi:MAG: PAS domain-containing protein [Sulfurimonas sp.]|nr:PAS domain-containing protein [Sulfurimonas sp.]